MATGLRIAEASDNAGFWSVATCMRAQKAVFAAVEDSIGVALGIVDTALAVQQPVLENMQEMMNDLLRGFDRVPNPSVWSDPQLKMLDTDIFNRTKVIGSLITSAYYNGVNLLYRPNGGKTSYDFVVGADNSGGVPKLQTMTMDLTKIALVDGNPTAATNFGVLTQALISPTGFMAARYFFYGVTGWGPTGLQLGFYPPGSATSNYQRTHIKAHMMMLDTLQQQVTGVFAYLGAVKTRLEQQLEQARRIQTVYEKGVGELVDADIDAESARAKALDAQKQLATQMLTIVNNHHSTSVELLRA